MTRRVPAFDSAAVHAGNRGLGIDYAALAPRVEALLARMTRAQKFNELRGLQRRPIDGLYHAGGALELGLPALRMVDGPRGARAGTATAFPVAMARGASFDVLLERRIGLAIGSEVAARGGNVVLAPTINLLRHPGWGRAQETYSEDPHHLGAMAVAFVSGAQNHVLASPKHFALNNLENTRFELSADIGARALHELYLPHFRRCVQEAGAASIMSAYNKVNDVYCGEHPQLLEDILRGEWGFRGFVESDWILGTRSTAAALNAGLDIEMPAPHHFSDARLEAALQSGELSEAVIDRAVARVLTQKLAWLVDAPPPVDPAVVEGPAHVELSREAAEKSLVLLTNRHQVLPLDPQTVTVALVGDLADQENLGDRGSSFVRSTSVATVRAGLEARLGAERVRYFATGDDLQSVAEADVTVVVVGLTYRDEGEFIPTAQAEAEGDALARGGDRADLALPSAQRALIARAVAHSRRVVVLLYGGSAITVDDWIADVDGLVMIWYPGREGGHAVARTLCGDVNGFGRLPVSIPHAMADLPPWDIATLNVPHDLLHGYRYLDHHQRQAAFPFGFGLSYTTFAMSDLQVSRCGDGFEVDVRVTNTGPRAGAAVPQLYVSCLGSKVFRANKELKGFGRVELAAGEEIVLVMRVTDDDLRCFDDQAGSFSLEPCDYLFRVGASAADLPLARCWRYDGADWSDAGSPA